MSIIRSQVQAVYSNYGNNLSKLLTEINATGPGTISRRKLTLLIQSSRDESSPPPSPKLSLPELDCLNSFLEAQGLGFMMRPPVIEELVTKPRVHFVLPAKSIGNSTHVSFWDNQAFVHFASLLNQYGRVVQFKLHYKPKNKIFNWPEPVVYLASPKVSKASEYAMRRLFDMPKTAAADEHYQLPFFFSLPKPPESRFCISNAEISGLVDEHQWEQEPFDDFKPKTDWGFGVNANKKIYIERQHSDTHAVQPNEFAHGILAVGKNDADELRIICAGSTGPSTFGLAEALHSSSLARRGLDPAFAEAEPRRPAWAAFRFPISRRVDEIEQVPITRWPGQPKLLHSEGFIEKAR